jgi:hypothetical protein
MIYLLFLVTDIIKNFVKKDYLSLKKQLKFIMLTFEKSILKVGKTLEYIFTLSQIIS